MGEEQGLKRDFSLYEGAVDTEKDEVVFRNRRLKTRQDPQREGNYFVYVALS